MRGMIRGMIDRVVEGAIKRISVRGYSGETITDREYFQHYGFTSRPLAGAECIVIREGNHFVAIASDDRRYRIAIEDGEVVIYTDEGDRIHFKRNKEIFVQSGNKLTVEVANDVVVNTKRLTATATEQAVITSPDIRMEASTKCQITSAEINLGGDRATLRRLIDERFKALFDSHTHPGIVAGPSSTGAPNQQLVLDNHATDQARGL